MGIKYGKHMGKNQYKDGVLREESDSFPTCLGPVPGAAEPSPGDQVEAAAGTGGCRNGGQEPGPFL